MTEYRGLRRDGYVIVDNGGLFLSDEYGGATRSVRNRYRSTIGSWMTMLKLVCDDVQVLACVEKLTAEVTDGLEASRQLDDSLRSFAAVVGNVHAHLCRCLDGHEGWSSAEMDQDADGAFDNAGDEAGRDDDSVLLQERTSETREVESRRCESVLNEQVREVDYEDLRATGWRRVCEAYVWLKENNPHYSEVEWYEGNAKAREAGAGSAGSNEIGSGRRSGRPAMT